MNPSTQSEPNPTYQLTSMKPGTSSYANVTSTTCFPKKDQAIILYSIDCITLREYLLSLSSVIPASNIRFIYLEYRIPDYVYTYLDSKKTADSLIDNKKNVKIKDHVLEIKPLITRNKRIILSNVCPVIPNYIIEEKFKELGIQILSTISFVKIGVTDPGFSHILSFRRQLYISPEDEKRIPESFQVNYEGTNYWIYLSTDAVKCFSCNTLGQLAKNCPQAELNNPLLTQETQLEPVTQLGHQTQESQQTQDSQLIEVTQQDQKAQKSKDTNLESNIVTKGKKRIPSPSTSESSKIEFITPLLPRDFSKNQFDMLASETDDTEDSNFSIEEAQVITKTKKKIMKVDSRTDEEIWKDIIDSISETDKTIFPLDIDQFISLLDNTRETEKYIPRPDTKMIFLKSLGSLTNLSVLGLEYAHLADGTGEAILNILPILKKARFRLHLICRENQIPYKIDPDFGCGGLDIPDTAWRVVSVACPDLVVSLVFFRIRDYDNVRRFLTPSIQIREVHLQYGIDLLPTQRQDSDLNCFMRHVAYRYGHCLQTMTIHHWRFTTFPLRRIIELLPNLVRIVYTGRVEDEVDLKRMLTFVATGVCDNLEQMKILIQDEVNKREYWLEVVASLNKEFADIMETLGVELCLDIYRV